MNEEKNNAQNPYIMPASIIAAGVIIAAAVIYVSGQPSAGPTPVGEQGSDIPTPLEVAEATGLSGQEFESCLTDPAVAAAVTEDFEEAVESGGLGTPYTVIISADGTKYPAYGALPFEAMADIIEDALALDKSNLVALEAAANGPVGEVRPVTEEDHIRGNLDAPVQIVEFSDLECPFCKSFHPTMLSVMSQYEGQVVWAYRHLPLESIHPLARPLAEGSECAARIGGDEVFWNYVDYVFSN